MYFRAAQESKPSDKMERAASSGPKGNDVGKGHYAREEKKASVAFVLGRRRINH